MSSQVRLRILGYTITLVVHVSNIIYMRKFAEQNPTQNKYVAGFKSLEYRFFTTWNSMLQIAYAMLALVCDLVIMNNTQNKGYSLPKVVADFRRIMFDALVWPCSWTVFAFFWSLYIYDRNLIYPEYLDQVIPTVSNHIIHTMIVPVVLWEVAFRPRSEPSTHARNIMQLTLHVTAYLCVMFFTYFERGIWLYPVFKKLSGSIFFPIVLIAIGGLFLIFYYIQWPITRLIHGDAVKTRKAEKKTR